MRLSIFGLLFLLGLAVLAQATAPPTSRALSPDVEAYVKVHVPVVALTHVRVIDGTGAAVREDQTVVISSGRIAAAGDTGKVSVPEGAKTLDLSGDTVLPGLVGMHDHFFYPAPSGSAPASPGESRCITSSGSASLGSTSPPA